MRTLFFPLICRPDATIGRRVRARGLHLLCFLALTGCATAPKQTIDLKVPVPVYDYAK